MCESVKMMGLRHLIADVRNMLQQPAQPSEEFVIIVTKEFETSIYRVGTISAADELYAHEVKMHGVDRVQYTIALR